MEKKIIIVWIILYLFGCSSENPNSTVNINQVEIKYDTILFGSEKSLINYIDTFQIDNVKHIEYGLLIKSKGNGIGVWIDSLIFHFRNNNRFISVVSSLNYGYSLLYYNGDSLFVEKVATNKPKVKKYDTNKFSIICITDSSYTYGIFNKSMIFYRYDILGNLTDRKAYYPIKEENKKYNFNILAKIKGDSIFVYKDENIDFVYK